MYDYIIIGGGIAGLYMNILLAQTKKYKTLLVEKNNYLGGRAIETKFHNEYIKLGAGIAAPHNKNLLSVLDKLNIKYNTYPATINLLFDTTFDMKNAIKKIIKKYKTLKKENNDDIHNLNVEQFIRKYFGNKFFIEYNKIAEYKDYLQSDLEYYIKYYPINDHNPSPYKLISLTWTDLINKLEYIIKKYNQEIKLNFNVNTIKLNKNNEYKNNEYKNNEYKNNEYKNNEYKNNEYKNNEYKFIINNKYKTKNIIFAITINNLQNIIDKSNIIDIKYNKYIGSVPFLRIYTYHKNGHKLNIPRYNIIDNAIEKIIVISDKILMISYSDNNYAEFWYKLYNTNKEKLLDKLKELFTKAIKQNIEIDDIEFVYWKEGIHYYYPQKNIKLKNIISNLSHPYDNIYVIGEMLSYKQGWVEGSIESANRIYKVIKNN
jgi:protoporphyrinogen oxidase